MLWPPHPTPSASALERAEPALQSCRRRARNRQGFRGIYKRQPDCVPASLSLAIDDDIPITLSVMRGRPADAPGVVVELPPFNRTQGYCD